MPTIEQLNHISASDTDGSTTTSNDDGSTTTDWSDGTQRVDYPDSSAMVIFPDGAVLNLYADGAKALNDANGNPLDPATGAALGAGGPIDHPPDIGPDKLLRLMQGDERVADLKEAAALVETFEETLKGEIDPVEWVSKWIEMVLQIVKALATEERGCYFRGWCYTVLYSALDMGTPPEPLFSGSQRGDEQDQINQDHWDKGVRAAASQLADGARGTSLRNRALLRVAKNGSSPLPTLKEMYGVACDHTDDWQLKMAYEDILGWPQPTGA